MRISRSLQAIALVGLAAMPAGLAADNQQTDAAELNSIIHDTGVANRLVVGEILRVLSQEIPAAACHLHHRVNVDDAADNLTYGVDQVDELLTALTDGDIFWGITTPETRRKTIAEIESLRAQWHPVQEAAQRLMTDPADAGALDLAMGMSHGLLDTTDRLLATLDGQYSGSAEIQRRDVMFIQVSGRMAALNQRIALQSCILAGQGYDAEIAADLTQSAEIYKNSLWALQNGMDALGILPPQTPGIADKMAEIADIWVTNEPVIARLAATETLSATERHDLYFNLIDERVLVLDLLYLYQDHAKVH